MNKIYTSDNYIVVDKGGKKSTYSKAHSEYDESIDEFILRKFPDKGVLEIPFTEVPLWFDVTGAIPYTLETLREFLRQNTGALLLGGTAKLYKYTVDVFDDLALVTGAVEGDIARVYNKQGIWGINQKNEGAYTYLSGVWEYGSRSLQSEVLANDAEIALKEDLANKSIDIETDKASDIKYPSVKAVYDWAKSIFELKASYRAIPALTNGVPIPTDKTLHQFGSGSEFVTLLPAVGQTRIINIKNGKTGGAVLEVYPDGTDTIEGDTDFLESNDEGDNITLQSDGVSNYIIL